MAAGTPTFNDMYVLSQSTGFQNRVQASLLSACIAISSESNATQFHYQRLLLLQNILSSPTNLAAYVQLFAGAVATNSTVIADATQSATNYTALTTANVATQEVLATDVDIGNALSACYDAFLSH